MRVQCMALSLVKLNKGPVNDSTALLDPTLTLASVHNGLVKRRLLSEVKETYLDVSWSISRAQDTYGYNRVTVRDIETSKRFVECGGGFDMLGSALGQWLQHTHQDLLLCHSEMAYAEYNPVFGFRTKDHQSSWLYGMTYNIKGGDAGGRSVSLDGACGLDCMLKIAKHIGLILTPVKSYNRKGQSTGIVGWHVSAKEFN